jgi:hypothetical protein
MPLVAHGRGPFLLVLFPFSTIGVGLLLCLPGLFLWSLSVGDLRHCISRSGSCRKAETAAEIDRLGIFRPVHEFEDSNVC